MKTAAKRDTFTALNSQIKRVKLEPFADAILKLKPRKRESATRNLARLLEGFEKIEQTRVLTENEQSGVRTIFSALEALVIFSSKLGVEWDLFSGPLALREIISHKCGTGFINEQARLSQERIDDSVFLPLARDRLQAENVASALASLK